MGNLIVRIVAKEFVTPHRHVARSMRTEVSLSIDDLENLLFWKYTAPACGDAREIRYLDREKRRDRAIPTRFAAVAAGTRDLIEMRRRRGVVGVAGARSRIRQQRQKSDDYR